jgi:hypothetical protein
MYNIYYIKKKYYLFICNHLTGITHVLQHLQVIGNRRNKLTILQFTILCIPIDNVFIFVLIKAIYTMNICTESSMCSQPGFPSLASTNQMCINLSFCIYMHVFIFLSQWLYSHTLLYFPSSLYQISYIFQ